MERTINVRIPEILAGKVDRFAAEQGMTQSELVRAALRDYIGISLENSARKISRELRPALRAEGVTEENVVEWYRKQVGKAHNFEPTTHEETAKAAY